jgi:effector-binding domain-containing protein
MTKDETGMKRKEIIFTKYARLKQAGSYTLIKRAGENMTTELEAAGYEIISPYVEIYGHWTNDETKLETELIMGLK